MAEELQLREATKELRFATMELQKFNQSTAAEIGKLVGKDLQSVTEKFTAGFMQVPGVQTLGAIGKTLFDRGFAALKQKRELRALADQLGLNDKQLEQLKFNKKVQDAQQKANEELVKGAKEFLGISVKVPEELSTQAALVFDQQMDKFRDENNNLIKGMESFLAQQDIDVTNEMARQSQILDLNSRMLTVQDEDFKLSRQNRKLLEQNQKTFDMQLEMSDLQGEALTEMLAEGRKAGIVNKAAEQEVANAQERAQDKQTTLLEGIGKGITGLSDGLLKGLAALRDKGFGAFGLIAGLVAAPVVAITTFFSEVAAEFKVLSKMLTGINIRFFKPIVDFFDKILARGQLIAKFKDMPKVAKFLELVTKYFNFLGKVGSGFVSAVGQIGRFFKPVVEFFKRISGFFTGLTKITGAAGPFISGMAPVLNFAAKAGAVLGKIFLPFTILKGLFDFFSSASEEYQDSGSIINAITAGIGGAIGGFFGILLDLPKNIISWLFEAFLGEGNIISTTLDSFSFTDVIKEIVDYGLRIILSPITFVKNLLSELFNSTLGIFRSFFDIVKGIFTLDIELIGDGVFGLLGGIWDLITAPFRAVFDTVASIFDFDFMSLIESLPGGKNAMKLIRGVGSFFFGDDEEKKIAEAEKEAGELRLRRADRLQRQRKAAEAQGNYELIVDGQVQGADVRAARIAAKDDEIKTFGARQGQIQMELDRLAEIDTLPEYFGQLKSSLGTALFGADEEKIMALKEKQGAALQQQGRVFEDMVAQGFMTEEEKALKLKALVDEYDNLILEEQSKGIGLFKTIGTNVINTFTNAGESIFGVFQSVLDFDFMGFIKKIPGAESILNFLGLGEEQSIAAKIKEAEDRIARSEAGENVYFGREAGGRNRDRQEIERLLQEQRELDTEGGVAPVIIQDNSSRVTTSTSSSTVQMRPVRDVSPPVGTLATVGVY